MRRAARRPLLSTLLLLATVACNGGKDSGKDAYVFEAVDRGTIASTVSATGTVNPVNSVQVGTYVSGAIREIFVDYNSPVTKGQPVAKIDPAPFQVKVLKADASLANAKAKADKDRADLAMKKLTLRRNRDLLTSNLISQNDVDAAASEHDQAVAQLALDDAAIRQASADLDDAKVNLGYTDITSPVNGVVVSRSVNVGQTVAATFQTPTLFLIAEDLTKMQVDTNVSESDIGTVAAGQAAHFVVDAYPGREFQGSVVQVRNAPTTVQNVVTYDVVIAVDNPKMELKPGMTATATIVTAEVDDALRVSARALRFNPDTATPTVTDGERSEATPRIGGHREHGEHGPSLWVQQADGSIKKTPVKVGIRNEQYVEILSSDIEPGAKIAVALKRSKHQAPQQQTLPGMGGGRFR